MAAPLYLLVVLLPSVLGQCTVQTATPLFSRSVYGFSVDLIQRLGIDTGNHFIASPVSLWTILSLLSLGADGITLTEINRTLRRHPMNCFNKRYLDIFKEITSNTLERASAFFIDKKIPVSEEYQRRLTKTGVCEIQILPFENYETVASTINDYVSRVTHGTIQEVVISNKIGVFLILIDAIYFKGAWNQPFEPSRTEPAADFYDESGSQIGNVSMMHGLLSVRTADFDQIQAKVLELPYGDQNRLSMLIFLPYANSTVTTVMGHLKQLAIRSIFVGLNQYPDENVDVRLPRFKISSNSNLREMLINMGLTTVFDDTQAQFPHISEYILSVYNVRQKAEIEVTEEGMEASVASGVIMTSGNLPKQFTVNKPFLFMIVDKESNIPLLTGAYSRPY